MTQACKALQFGRSKTTRVDQHVFIDPGVRISEKNSRKRPPPRHAGFGGDFIALLTYRKTEMSAGGQLHAACLARAYLSLLEKRQLFIARAELGSMGIRYTMHRRAVPTELRGDFPCFSSMPCGF